MATEVDGAKTEIEGLLVEFAPRHEGLRDFQRLNLKEDTQQEISAALVIYDRRKGLLEVALAALDALIADGHPDLPIREISPAAFADLQDNTATVEAAMGRFASNAAANLAMSAGEIAKKS